MHGSIKSATLFAAILTVILVAAAQVLFAGNLSSNGGDYYRDVVQPALLTVKKAMPPAPAGWVVAGETTVDAEARSVRPGEDSHFRFAYQIKYKRVAGIREEKQKLSRAYAESSERNGTEANAQIEELLRQQTATSLALRRATKRGNQAEIQRLNDELDENGRRMRAVHEETDKKIAGDVAPYLIKDAEAVIDVTVNDDRADALSAEQVFVKGAAVAFRWEGEQSGPAVWKEGKTVILLGTWQQADNGVYRGPAQLEPYGRSAQTVKLTITAAKGRAEELFKQTDRKAILSLLL